MAIKKREGSDAYYVMFKFQGQRIRQSAGTSNAEEARQYEAQLRKSLWEQSRLGVAPEYRWEDGVKRYLLTRKKLDSVESTKEILRWLSERLIGKPLKDITNDLWLDLVQELRRIGNRRSAGRGVFKPLSDGRLVQYRAAISSVLNAAHEAGWLPGVPRLWQPDRPRRVVRWASRDEIVRLMAELPLHLAYPAAYAMLSGVRGGNVTALRKANIHWDIGLIVYDSTEVKDDDVHVVPITPEIEAILKDCWDAHPEFVFVTHRGKPWQGKFSNHGWYDAMKRAQIEKFTWHAWRHTWATWHRMNGTSMGDLQALGGWSDNSMVQRYAHFNNELLIRAANNLNVGVPQKVPQRLNPMTSAFPDSIQIVES